MKSAILLFVLLLVFGIPANCCLNYYYTADKDGHLHYHGEGEEAMRKFNTNFNIPLLQDKIATQELTVGKNKTFMDLSDYAVMLMKMGKNDVALTILQSLYAAHPDQYQLAANLGTSYELAGEVDSALKYIKRGIELNSNAHEGSEWVHVKVLETKLKMRSDSLYLNTHTVLDLTAKQESDSLVMYQLEIQIRERFPFCPGPDRIMASLIEDLADITLNINSIEHARVYYSICKHYFGDSSANIDNKIATSIKLLDKHNNVRPDPDIPGKEGENVRLGSFRYLDMLGDNNPNKRQPDWTVINTDAVALLAIVGLKPVPPPVPADTASVDVQLTNEGVSGPEDDDGTLWLIIAVASCCSVFTGLFWYKKRK